MTKPTLASTLLPLALIAGLVVLLGLRIEGAPPEAAMSSPLEPWLKSGVASLVSGTEIAAGIVVGAAVLLAAPPDSGEDPPAARPQSRARPRVHDRERHLAVAHLLNTFLGDEIRESGEHA